jgi:gliding motility-associated-like protein
MWNKACIRANEDVINDTLNIGYLSEYPNDVVDVYDRYSDHLYHSFGYGTSGNGSYKGERLPVSSIIILMILKASTTNR